MNRIQTVYTEQHTKRTVKYDGVLGVQKLGTPLSIKRSEHSNFWYGVVNKTTSNIR